MPRGQYIKIDANELLKKYFVEKLSIRQIGVIYNVPYSTMHRKLQMAGVVFRKRGGPNSKKKTTVK